MKIGDKRYFVYLDEVFEGRVVGFEGTYERSNKSTKFSASHAKLEFIKNNQKLKYCICMDNLFNHRKDAASYAKHIVEQNIDHYRKYLKNYENLVKKLESNLKKLV